MPTEETLKTVKKIVEKTVCETLEEVGPVPSGHLYVMLTTLLPWWNLELHTHLIADLVAAGKVTNTNHLLDMVRR